MSRPSTVTVVTIFAFLFAGCASILVYNYLKKQANRAPQGLAIATAATEVPIGTKFAATHVKLSTWPKDGLPSGYFTDTRQLLGRVAVRQLSPGDIVTEQKLMPQNPSATGGVMAYMVPQGHRAVTVAVNEVAGVAGFITPNSRVDVILTSPLPGVDREDNTSKIILQNVPVLATGQGTEQKEGKPTVVPTVTLDLAPDDAEKLIVGTKKGSLQLLLRNVIDTASVSTPGTTITKVLGRGQQPAPARSSGPARPRKQRETKPAPVIVAKYSVEVIKGSVKTTRDFPADQ